MEDVTITVRDVIFIFCLLDKNSHRSEPQLQYQCCICWLCLWLYLLRLSKMPWNLPPSVSSWSSRWLRCMSSGLRERPPEAWSWWHQQGSPAKPPALLRTRLKADKRKRSVCAIWPPQGLSCTVWCDNSTTYIGEETNTSLRDETDIFLFRCAQTSIFPDVCYLQ